MKCYSRFLITTLLFFTNKARALSTRFIICQFSMVNSVHHKCYFFANNFKTNISDSLSNVCGYVLALVVKPLDFGYLAVEAVIQ